MESLRDKRILVIDDEPDLLSLVGLLLNREGARVTTALDGTQGLAKMHQEHPDLVLLDILMPGLTGYETCARINETSKTPVIFLSALANTGDIVNGLNQGAVDYVTKPFAPSVLVARIHATLRFIEHLREDNQACTYDDDYLTINVEQRSVHVAGVPVQLTATEFQVMSYFCRHTDELLEYTDIITNVWGDEYKSNTNYVHVYVWRLRQKIEKDPKNPQYFISEPGTGYRFSTQASN
ncbi:MAG: response regulator transcription factor [Anaerolineae bacterium]|nr:response regulator transcription factor [Anaerolineae bacterium]